MLTVVLPADTWKTGGNFGVDFNVVGDGVGAARRSTSGFVLKVLCCGEFGCGAVDGVRDRYGFLLFDFGRFFGNND
jgi:hypothetical protein